MFENLFLLLYVTCFFQVKKITLHEDFEIYYKGDDIALFVLEVAVAYSEHVRPLCLPQIDEHLPPSTICYTGGWGYLNHTRQFLLLIFANNSFLREWAHCYSCFSPFKGCSHVKKKNNDIQTTIFWNAWQQMEVFTHDQFLST